jgi:hypothetical protein
VYRLVYAYLKAQGFKLQLHKMDNKMAHDIKISTHKEDHTPSENPTRHPPHQSGRTGNSYVEESLPLQHRWASKNLPNYLEADVRRNKRKMGGFACWEIFGTGFKFGFFCGFPATYRFQNFGFFHSFLRFLGDPKNSQNTDFSAVFWDFEGRAHPKILCGFPAINRAQNLDLPVVSRNF